MFARGQRAARSSSLDNTRRRRPGRLRVPPRRQDGAFAIMFSGALIVMLAVCAAAIDLGYLYNRKAELHGMAKAAALAAATQLDGTKEGVNAALLKAAAVAATYRHTYSRSYTWSDAAIRFGKSPTSGGDWRSADAAKAQPGGIYYVEVDTSRLTDGSGTAKTFMMGVLSPSLASVTVSEHAIAGRANLRITPLAVCAMAPAAAAVRVNPGAPVAEELVEFGFRRGVGYDLMALNPGGTDGETFVIDPFAVPGTPYASSNTTVSKVGPSVCSGKVWAPGVMGDAVHVSRPFPLASLYHHLNSRFDDYTAGACNPDGAPPDFNVKPFRHSTITWMTRPPEQGAKNYKDKGRNETIADPLPPPSGTTPEMYGVLWSFAKAAKYSSYVAGEKEPEDGYDTFLTGDWKTLYAPKPTVSGYPGGSETPYQATGGSNYESPSGARLDISQVGRRVLHVPLLSCPVPAGTDATATVLGIGRFFMTVPATDARIHAEFAGTVPESALLGKVELFR